MEKIAIMTDVNAGLDYVEDDLGITSLRSIIHFKDHDYIDGIDMKADEFYKRIIKTNDIPSTSVPPLGSCMKEIEKFIDEGYTDVIMYAISYKMSSIGLMVETLKKEYSGKINIFVVDTKCAAYFEGYIAIKAMEMVKQNKSVKEILEYSNYLISNRYTYFIVDNLMYLVKNGRLSTTSGVAGTIFNVKPILSIDKDGTIVTYKKVKTFSNAITKGKEILFNILDECKKAIVFVMQTYKEKEALEFIELIESKYKDKVTVQMHLVTPAVGAHIGANILGFGCFVLEK